MKTDHLTNIVNNKQQLYEHVRLYNNGYRMKKCNFDLFPSSKSKEKFDSIYI